MEKQKQDCQDLDEQFVWSAFNCYDIYQYIHSYINYIKKIKSTQYYLVRTFFI